MSEAPELPFTGERYVPGVHGQIELEHRHRYYLARQLAAGKRVLDIACGEGYGSEILAATAQYVVGVDIDADTVNHARKKYARGNLSFLPGSCEHIPLPDKSIDLVVSFETLEHTSEHQQMLSEITRILSPDGILIISTPNRAIYRAANDLPNPFHLKELEFSEFATLLSQCFRNSQPFGQRVAYGSLIAPLENCPLEYDLMAIDGNPIWGSDGPANWWRYFLMAASNGPLPDLHVGLVGFAAAEDYENGVITRLYNSEVHLQSRLIAKEREYQDLTVLRDQLQSQLEQNAQNLSELTRSRAELQMQLEDKKRECDELTNLHSGLQSQLEQKSRDFEESNRSLAQLQSQLDDKKRELEKTTILCEELQSKLDQESRDRRELTHSHSELRSQLEQKNRELLELAHSHTELRSQLQIRDHTISELRDHIAVLLHGRQGVDLRAAELEAKLNKMSRSASWLITRPLRELGRWGRRLRRLTRPLRRALVGRTAATNSGTAPSQAMRSGGENGRNFLQAIKTLRKNTRPIRYFIMGKVVPAQPPVPPVESETVPMRLAETPPQIPGFSPLVSIIVPNYNHEKYLRSRLESIYNQTYRNIEIILLDDASTDGSMAILSEYAERFLGKTRLIQNQTNSGSPFAQWRKGMDLARGELIWIAESDDDSAPQFLSELVPMFANTALTLAFCKTHFIDDAGKVVWSTDEYLHDLAPELWQRPFIMGAATLVQRAWIVRNIVPNVGSAVFRKPTDISKLCDFGWTGFKVCGDWIFYLNVCRGGLVGYSEKPMNLYRLHPGNTSVNLHKHERFYREHAEVLRFAQLYYHVSADDCQRHIDSVSALWRLNRPQESLDFIYNTYHDLMNPKRRRLNIMVCGFALTSGGGETFPINLANALRAMDCNVTFCSFNREPTIEAIRRRIRPDVPLVELTDPGQLTQFVDELKIDVIHTQHAWVDVAVADLLQTNTRCALVATTHGMYDMMDAAEIKRIMALIEKRVDRFCYAAEKNLKNFPDQFILEKRFTNIPNATEIRPLAPLHRSNFGISDTAFVLCLISRGIAEKGWSEAIAACKLARQSTGRDIQLLLVGNGPESERLAATGTESFVHLLGFRSDVLELFTLADVGLLPTRFSGESFPLVLLECVAAQRPMIATDVGEIRRIMTGASGPAGVIIPLENGQIPVNQLADAIARLARDEELLREVRKRTIAIKDKFSAPLVAKGYLSAYIDAFISRNTLNDRDILDNDRLTEAR